MRQYSAAWKLVTAVLLEIVFVAERAAFVNFASMLQANNLMLNWQSVDSVVYGYTWQAEALWGGVTPGHVHEESLWASGIWKLQHNGHFTTHDDNVPNRHFY